MKFAFLPLCILVFGLISTAQAQPSAPTDSAHPGSKSYAFTVTHRDLTCAGRVVKVYLPTAPAGEQFPVVVFGHGQALGADSYEATFEHLAKKGVAVIFPAYDTGFFDQDWTRMGRDYVNLAACAIQQLSPALSSAQVVFSGHSKGAYVASIAAGLATREALAIRPGAIVLLEAAGADSASLGSIAANTLLTVVFSENDTVVGRDLSETVYATAGSTRKQFIFMKSYPGEASADHFWPLTKRSTFGGGPEGAYHYYGSWKWLVAAALDLKNGGHGDNPFLYGAEATGKGVAGLQDDVRRSWQTETPRMDSKVRTFLADFSQTSDVTLPVLITYRAAPVLPAAATATHAQVEIALRSHVALQEDLQINSMLMSVGEKPISLWIANGTLLRLNRDQIRTLATNSRIRSIDFSQGVSRIVDDVRSVNPAVIDAFTYGLRKLKVPELRALNPHALGTGIRVGIIDTGANVNHPDLVGRVSNFRNFTSSGSTTVSFDDHGHGSHVAGTIAGGNTSGTAIGIAPESSLIIAKAFDEYGGTSEDQLLLAMQWVADPDNDPLTNDYAQVVNNSWNNDVAFLNLEPADVAFCVATDNWIKLGIVPVVAAGNSGPSPGTVQVPAACPGVLAVGATNSSDGSAYFSARGPTKWKSFTLQKPDISAPGEDIKSVGGGTGYKTMSGTSMAAPHAVGAMAVLIQAQPTLTVPELEQRLMSTSDDLGNSGPDLIYGAGRINLLQAVQAP